MKETGRRDGTSGGSNRGRCTGVFSGGIAGSESDDSLPFNAEDVLCVLL